MDATAADRKKTPILVSRHFEVPCLVALLRGGYEVFVSVLDPLYRYSEFHGRHRNDDLFRIETAFRSEATPHIRRDHAHATFIAAKMLSNHAADHVGRLGGSPNR